MMTVGTFSSANATTLLFDDFDRLDSSSVENGWTEIDESNLHSEIKSNQLAMWQSDGLAANTEDGQDTRIHRLGSQHDDILLNGSLSITMGISPENHISLFMWSAAASPTARNGMISASWQSENAPPPRLVRLSRTGFSRCDQNTFPNPSTSTSSVPFRLARRRAKWQ